MTGVGFDDLVLGDASYRGTEDDARHIAAGLGGVQSNAFKPAPDFGNVDDIDPVQLDVLPVGEVRSIAGEILGDLSDHAQLLGAQRPAIDAYTHHEVAVFEFFRAQRGGFAAGDSLGALGVQTPPAKTSVQVFRVNRVEALHGIDLFNPLAYVQAIVGGLHLFAGVQRSFAIDFPLAVWLGRSFGASWCGCLRHVHQPRN